ncbi:MAG: hypothetical protein R3A48_15925 [Polyangiales bacterium]
MIEHARCATCVAPVDALRAAAVRLVDGRFRFYCSRECRDRDAPATRRSKRTAPRLPVEAPSTLEVMDMLGVPRASLPAAAFHHDGGPPGDGDARVTRLGAEPANPLPPALALAAGAAAALLAPLSSVPLTARLALIAAAVALPLGAGVRELWLARGDVGVLGWAVGVVGSLVPTFVALNGPLPELALGLRDTALLASLGPVVTWAARTHRVAAQSRLEAFRRALPDEALVPSELTSTGDDPGVETVDARRVHAGTEVEVRPGGVVPVDGVIRWGEAEIRPWPSAETSTRRRSPPRCSRARGCSRAPSACWPRAPATRSRGRASPG